MINAERPIESCLQGTLDKEIHAKFLQVLGYVGEKITVPLFKQYNTFIIKKIAALQHRQFPPNYSLETHARLLINFYSFRCMATIGQSLLERRRSGDEKSEENVTQLIKVLFHHGLVSKHMTANFALVELDQFCRASKLTLPQLYQKYRTKFLRLIIKGILDKLVNHGEHSCSSESSSGSNGQVSQLKRTNCVISYMTRAFETFNISMITSDEIAQSLIIITNLIQRDKYTRAIGQFLDHLATYQKIDTFSLIRSHIQTIVVSLLLRRKMSQFDMTESLKKLCLFCHKKPRDVLADKFANIKGTLLLHYSKNRKLVTDAIYYLSLFEKDEMDQPFEDEFEDETVFIEYLKPTMIGILLGIDSHFTQSAKDLGSNESIANIDSLGRLISMLDNEQIHIIHHKLLSTLSLLVRIRPTRDNEILNQAIVEVWKEFMSKLDRLLKDALLINICVALYDLIEDCPTAASKIYLDLIKPYQQILQRQAAQRGDDSNTDIQIIEDHSLNKLNCLFFIPNKNGFEDIYELLTPYVHRRTTATDMQSLSIALKSVLPLMKYENQKCHLIAVNRIKDLLKTNQQLLTSSMLVNLDEPIDSTISKTIELLLANCSTQDNECSAIIAECLGILGAINPLRLDSFIYGGLREVGSSFSSLSDDNFIIELVERLKNSLFSDRISESETANYALQVVVKKYHILNQSIRSRLSVEAIRAGNLCKNTSYMATKRTPPDLKSPIYIKFKNENQYSYKEWLDKFSLVLISTLQDPDAQEVLHACTYNFKHNVKLAEYILPNVMTHIILHQPENLDVIQREIIAILDEDIGLSSQDVDTVYTDDIRNNLQTLHFQCANMMFCVLDALTRLEITLVKAKSQPQRDHIGSIRTFIASVPKDKLAILASKCRAHARALYYFDQYYFANKQWPTQMEDKPINNTFDKYWTDLQRIYMALDESFEAAGIEVVRNSYTTLSDDIANYESLGKFDKAYACYDALIDSIDDKIDKKSLHEDALKCLSNQGDFQRLLERSQRLIQKYPQYERSFLPAATEARWKLGKWDELDYSLKSGQLDSLLESAPVSQGFLLASFNQSRKMVMERLKMVRGRLMKPLSIAMIDRSVYFRGYQNLMVLHEIEDIALTLEALEGNIPDTQSRDENNVDQLRSDMTKKLIALFQIWSRRNKLVEPSIRSLEPLLTWQRSIVQALINKYPFLQPQINVEVGQMWLTSAKVARESRCFDRAFYCTIQAQRNFGVELPKTDLDLRVKLTMEQVKLDWDQGESTKAIRGLKAAVQKLSGHGLFKHLHARRFVAEESRRKTSEITIEEYPDLSVRPCDECEIFALPERESFSKLMILLTKYSEEAAAGTPKTLLAMYEECVHLGVNQEETLLLLARYYDKLATYYTENPNVLKLPDDHDSIGGRTTRKSVSQEKLEQMAYREDIITKLMEQSVLAFGNSLKWGTQYLEESMPRMLNIWLDLGSKRCAQNPGEDETNRRSSYSSPTRAISSRIENTVRFIDTILPRKESGRGLPSHYYLSALSLLLSRVHHPHSGVCDKTIKILEQLTIDYPHQMMWRLVALLHDESIERRRAADKIIKGSTKKEPKIASILGDNRSLADVLAIICLRLTMYDDRGAPFAKQKLGSSVTIDQIDENYKYLQLKKMKAIAPVQSCMRPKFPTENDCKNLEKYNIFPEHYLIFVNEIDPRFKVYNSLQAPKQVNFKCRNGKKISIICKAGDDLRKDSRCTEFFDLLNKILRRSSQSSVRFFEIPTYLVLPLRSEAGLIEMVPNCETFRSVIEAHYRQRNGKSFILNEGLKKRSRKSDAADYDVYKIFVKEALPRVTPPVFQDVMKSKFIETTAWYMARVAYIRSTAIISMAGYMIGLGDRHLDNMMIDITQGRVVHVDFNLVFHQGESLAIPEIVPFRMTQNVVAGFGPMQKEGKFRKFCEIAMRVMRAEKELLITTLKPFLHDPCVDWVKRREGNANSRASKLVHIEEREGNKNARDRIRVVEEKLKGFPRSSIHRPLTVLSSHSVESQVDMLIEEASDLYNLSQMYYGWCPNI